MADEAKEVGQAPKKTTPGRPAAETVHAPAAPTAPAGFDPTAALGPLTALNDAALTAWTRSSEALLKGVTDVNRELLSLCGRWYDEAFDAPQSLRDEPQWEGAIRLAGSATERCLSETARVMNMVTETVGRASVPWAEFYARAVPEAFRARTD